MASHRLFTRQAIQWAGLILGPLLACAGYLALPEQYSGPAQQEMIQFSHAGRVTMAVMVWMAIWWLTEAIDISATALLPLALLPILGATSMREAASPYGSDFIFLFMGGFILALSMQRWGLDRRIALTTLRIVGTRPHNMVAGFMIATAMLSAFVSNTATAAMMLPVALSVIALSSGGQMNSAASGAESASQRNFALCLMLGIAYAASIGGLATIIGSPPNVFLVSFIRSGIAEPYRQDISFVQWLGIGVPLVVVFLPITWLLLTRVLYPLGTQDAGLAASGSSFLSTAQRELGPMRRGEWVTFIVFCCTALLWICSPVLSKGWTSASHSAAQPDYIIPPLIPGLTDAGIAMIAAMALFIIPVDVRTRSFTMNWATASKLPWGILILFGGGLSLAAAIQANGVAEFIGAQTHRFADVPPIVLVLLVTTAVIFFSELASNTATATTLVPILAAMAPGLDVHPYLLIIPAGIAASCAFMMPVGTPPNAIVFGSGHVAMPQMIKAGLWLNIIGIVLITALTYFVVLPLLL